MEVTKRPTRRGNTRGAFFTEICWHCPWRVVRFRSACLQGKASATVLAQRHELLLFRQSCAAQGFQGACQRDHREGVASIVAGPCQGDWTLSLFELQSAFQGGGSSRNRCGTPGQGRSGLRLAMRGAVL